MLILALWTAGLVCMACDIIGLGQVPRTFLMTALLFGGFLFFGWRCGDGFKLVGTSIGGSYFLQVKSRDWTHAPGAKFVSDSSERTSILCLRLQHLDCCHATLLPNLKCLCGLRIKTMFRLVLRPVNMDLGQISDLFSGSWAFFFFLVLTDRTWRRSGMDSSHKALGSVLTLRKKINRCSNLIYFYENVYQILECRKLVLVRAIFFLVYKKIEEINT